jgi:hypothetical protein
MDNQERRRGQHFHRGRRGPDRRGQERRTPPQPQEQHQNRDHVDVEQVMRDIRARIAQRHGIDLTTQQIQELAARRLEAILDPRAIKPALLDQLRKSAGAQPDPAQASGEPPYTYAEGTVYQSHRGIVRFFRRLFKPLLMLFFNPTPVEQALEAQTRMNADAAAREADRQRQQAEWNALHYEILQRLVTEVARASLDLQAMSAKVESLAAKVDFNERRVRHMEGSLHQARPSGRPQAPVESAPPPAAPAPGPSPSETVASVEQGTETPQTGDGPRRRRRRRRGRRGGGPGVPGENAQQPQPGAAESAGPETEDVEGDDAGDEVDETPAAGEAEETVTLVPAHGQYAAPAPEPEPAPAPAPEPEPAPAPILAHVPEPEPVPAPAPAPEPEPAVTPPLTPGPEKTE